MKREWGEEEWITLWPARTAGSSEFQSWRMWNSLEVWPAKRLLMEMSWRWGAAWLAPHRSGEH